MRSNLAFILERIPLNLEESGTDIALEWDVIAGGTYDAVLQTTVGGTPTRTTATVKAFVHTVQIAKQDATRYNEFEQGDCIIDLSPTVAVDGLNNLRFTIDGERWMVKPLGDKVPKSWDVVAKGQRLFRSLLLCKTT